jgi:hypothetical protein
LSIIIREFLEILARSISVNHFLNKSQFICPL